jgi:hypothetical protein
LRAAVVGLHGLGFAAEVVVKVLGHEPAPMLSRPSLVR